MAQATTGRYRYHIISWPGPGKGPRNEGTYANDLKIMTYFAEKWARERAIPHMVIDGNEVVYHAFASKNREKYFTPNVPA